MHVKQTWRWLAAVTVLVCAGAQAQAQALQLPALFSDQMVLQADAAVPVWGRAEPGQAVVVAFAGQRNQARADADGRWRVTLAPIAARTAGQMVIEAGGETFTVRDVLVGEVWFCSGQSNMEYYAHVLSKEGHALDDAQLPQFRMFKVGKNFTPQPLDEVSGRWVVCTPANARMFGALGYLFGSQLQRDLEMPVGMIQATWGGTRIKNWTPHDALRADPRFTPILEEERSFGPGPADRAEYAELVSAHKQDESLPKPVDAPHWPSRIYNSMVHPVMPYRVRGILWYQGESDAYNAGLYGDVFRAMIVSWRERWEQPDMPFLFVQLPGYRDPTAQPQARSFWGELRQQQMAVLDMPHVHMVVTTDIGDKDIHPPNKLRVNERLYQLAMATVYGRQDIAHRYPRVSDVRFNGERVYVKFDLAGSTLKTSDGEPVRGFALAGEDRQWRWADAEIDGDVVHVRSADVPNPVAVRYNHAEQTTDLGNLVDESGLPAAPHRSDQW
jgi:sialate O-acetylesterase